MFWLVLNASIMKLVHCPPIIPDSLKVEHFLCVFVHNFDARNKTYIVIIHTHTHVPKDTIVYTYVPNLATVVNAQFLLKTVPANIQLIVYI